jgi:3-carboxy-cis,cis-muconate cycloisomerase
MADLFWPGDERAGDAFSPEDFLRAMVRVESAWCGTDLALDDADVQRVASAAEDNGTPVVALLDLLRERHPEVDGLHTGLTSQDVVDTALVLCARAACATLVDSLDRAVDALDALAARHGDTPMAGRTLTQHAHPITLGHKLAQWRRGLTDALHDLRALRFPVQLGGPVGLGVEDPRRTGRVADALDLEPGDPWHTVRTPITRYADALVRTTDALGHVASDVLVLARTEVAEVAEPAGRGGSSSMPHKQNPVLSVLVRRAALTTPLLAAQLHLAAADQHDERPDGAWHTEWATLATLSRRTLAAASQAAELLAGLRVDTAAMARHLPGSPEDHE